MKSGRSFIVQPLSAWFATRLSRFRWQYLDNVTNLVWPPRRRIAGKDDADHSFLNRNNCADFELRFVRAARNRLALWFLHCFQSNRMSPTRCPTPPHAVVIAVLVTDVDSAEGPCQSRAQLKTGIIVDDRARVVAQSSVDFLYAPAEVTHERFRPFVQDSEASCRDEDFRRGPLALSSQPDKLVPHLQHVLDQVDFDPYVGKEGSIRSPDRFGILLVQERAFSSNHRDEAHSSEFPDRCHSLSERCSASNCIVLCFDRTFERDP